MTETVLEGPASWHAVAFDEEGWLYGESSSNVRRWSADGDAETLAVSVGNIHQMDWLPNGDLAASLYETGSVVRIAPDGGTEILLADVGAYGLVVGPDDRIWLATNQDLLRFDPDTGELETLVAGRGKMLPRVIAFGPGGAQIYLGSHNDGEIYVADLDADFDLVGDPVLFVSDAGSDPYMDCLTVDACGNVYVCTFSQWNLIRISPEGVSTVFVNWNQSNYGHGVAWGSGVGGWSETAIYLPQPYAAGLIVEIELGVGAAASAVP